MKLKIEVKLTASKAFLQVLMALAGSAALAKPEGNGQEELKEISPILATKVSQGIEAFPEELAGQPEARNLAEAPVEQKQAEAPTRKRRTKAEIEAEKAAAAAMQEGAESAEEATAAVEETTEAEEVETTQEDQSSDAEYTVEDIRAKVIAISNSKPHLKVNLKGILAEYGVERFTEINPKDFNEVMAKITKLA